MSLNPINYPGAEQQLASAFQAAGSKPVQRPEPLVKVHDIAYVLYEKADFDKQQAFLEDFGMRVAERSDEAVYLRGNGPSPWFYRMTRGTKSRFLGTGYVLQDRTELERVSQQTGQPIEPVTEPGGGERVRLTDPDGFIVDLLFGRNEVEPIACRDALFDVNTPADKRRVNRRVSTPPAPCAIERFGHLVIAVSDFQESMQWYMRHLGVIPTDVQCLEDGTPVLAFNRCDRGPVPADHHTVVLVQHFAPGCLHTAYEVFDLDAVGQGSQYLHFKGWDHFWGIGRHILGSQIFDYWKDPDGEELEHYADGDMFDASFLTQYHPLSPGSLWAWGDDSPPPPKPGPLTVLKLLLGKTRVPRQLLMQLAGALGQKARPWY